MEPGIGDWGLGWGWGLGLGMGMGMGMGICGRAKRLKLGNDRKDLELRPTLPICAGYCSSGYVLTQRVSGERDVRSSGILYIVYSCGQKNSDETTSNLL